MSHMDDLYGTDPVADNAQTRTPPTVTSPCAAECGNRVDTNREHVISHPFGATRPVRIFCSDACADDYCIAQERERQRVAS